MREGRTEAGASCSPPPFPAPAPVRKLEDRRPPHASPRPGQASPAQPQRGVPSSVLERPRGADAGRGGGPGGASLVASEPTAPGPRGGGLVLSWLWVSEFPRWGATLGPSGPSRGAGLPPSGLPGVAKVLGVSRAGLGKPEIILVPPWARPPSGSLPPTAKLKFARGGQAVETQPVGCRLREPGRTQPGKWTGLAPRRHAVALLSPTSGG